MFGRGGVNIGALKDLNWGLLGKWWWRFYNETNSLWRKVITSIYGKEGGLRGNTVRGRGSVWSNIVNIGRELESIEIAFPDSFGKRLGNGETISFWEDLWTSTGRLKERFRRLYHLDFKKEDTVVEKGGWQEGTWNGIGNGRGN